jgi:hypothetical protein
MTARLLAVRAHWPTDRRWKYNFDFDFSLHRVQWPYSRSYDNHVGITDNRKLETNEMLRLPIL